MDSTKLKSITYLKKLSDNVSGLKSSIILRHLKGKLTDTEFSEAIDTLLEFEKTIFKRFNACYSIDQTLNPSVVKETIEFLGRKLFLFSIIYGLNDE